MTERAHGRSANCRPPCRDYVSGGLLTNTNSAYDDTLSARVDNLCVEHAPFATRVVIK